MYGPSGERLMVVEIPKWLYDALVERKGRRNPNANRLFGAETNSTRTAVYDVASYCIRAFSWEEVERGIT